MMPELPALHSMDDYARFVLEQHSGTFIAAGLSMGGYIAFAIARLAPERLQGLILLDTRETADTAEARKGRYEMVEKVRAQGVDPVVESMLPKMLTPNAPAEMRERVRTIMSSSSPDWAIAALGAMAERPDSSPLLPSIKVPALIVVGEEDTITPPADAERMAKAIPNATLVKIPNAAHLANVEQSGKVNAAIEAFADRRRDGG